MSKQPNAESVVADALAGVYGKSGQTKACAAGLVSLLPKWQEEADQGWHSVEDNVHLWIWNWYPGGGTAAIAAGRIMDALAHKSTKEADQ